MDAIQRGHKDVVNTLVESKANLNITDKVNVGLNCPCI